MPKGIMDRFLKKANQKVNLWQSPTSARPEIAI